MISRVAGHCFWMNRYVERAGSMARLLRVNRAFVPDIELPDLQRWYPLVVVSGEEERYGELFADEENEETIQEYLTWDKRNPGSIVESIRSARENARTARDTVSSEMWETINGLWHWTQTGPGRHLYRVDRDHFYQHIRETGEMFQGQTEETLLNGESLSFMRLGRYLERGGQTARIMDVHYHTFPNEDATENPIRLAQWNAILACCSSMGAFQKRSTGTPTAQGVVNFLLFEPDLPRSVLHCLNAAQTCLAQIRTQTESHVGTVSSALLGALANHVLLRKNSSILGTELHDELTHLVDSLSDLCAAIDQEFFQASEVVTLDADQRTGQRAAAQQ